MTDFITTAEAALSASRSNIAGYFRQRVSVDSKADESPVTIADRTTEALMRDIIASAHPEHSILGEEHGIDAEGADYQWVIDPIDGTKSFISGMPTFGTLLGLTHKGEATLGIIDMPMLDERWVGQKGQPSTFNGSPCKVSAVTELADAMLYCTEPTMFNPEQYQRFEALTKQVAMRRFGGDCYSYGLLASGQIDLVVEGDLKYYDVMALIPVIEGAGGVITDWQGQPLTRDWDGLVVAAATPELHQKALAVINS